MMIDSVGEADMNVLQDEQVQNEVQNESSSSSFEESDNKDDDELNGDDVAAIWIERAHQTGKKHDKRIAALTTSSSFDIVESQAL